jgi:cephalosporin hydroxylase
MGTSSEPERVRDETDVGFEEDVRRFHDLYCQNADRTWMDTSFLGVPVVKCPLDLWIYQEILCNPDSRPDVVVETGTMRGGSSLFLATICDQIDTGRVITIDNRDLEGRPEHPRITYLTGSSTDETIVAAVKDAIAPGERVMVVLDSAHHKEHVLEELRLYSPLVTPNNYLVVEDTNVNSWRGYFEPGPLEAVQEFIEGNGDFAIDRSQERFFMTFNPNGYLRRLAPSGDGKPSAPRAP